MSSNKDTGTTSIKFHTKHISHLFQCLVVDFGQVNVYWVSTRIFLKGSVTKEKYIADAVFLLSHGLLFLPEKYTRGKTFCFPNRSRNKNYFD